MAWFLPDWVRWSDYWLNLGHGFFPVGLYGLFAGRLVERNKPEEDGSR